ncbi:MAG: triose-phosphate isomerase [Patescibacteria group bacterium]
MNNGNYHIIGNWKMNPDNRKEAKNLFSGIRKASQRRKSTIVVCPPFVYLPDTTSERLPKSLHLGAQNCFFKDRGSHTGEVSPIQLADMKVEYVILGHSERRAGGESDEEISRKIKAVLDAGMKPVICIGEEERDKEGDYLRFLESQLSFAFSEIDSPDLDNVLIAYEPIWAIGKSEEEAINGHLLHEIVVFVKRFLARKYSKEKGFSVPVLYGGSVSPANTEEIIKEGNADGLLIGRQSLSKEGFSEIIELVDNI